MLTCLHISDLHLGWTAGFLADKAEQFSRQRDGLLRRICQWVNQTDEQIDLVLIVGDLFDSHRPDPALVEAVMADLRSLTAAGRTVVTVPGNHDEITYHDSVYRRFQDRWPGYLVTNPMPQPPLQLTVAAETVYVYSVAYTGGLTKATDYLQPYPRVAAEGIHIGAFHGSLDWAAGERGLPLKSDALAAAGYDYVALGHFHQPSRLLKGRTTMVYSGMIESKGFSDLGCGQLTLVDIAPGSTVVRSLPWQVPPCRVEQVDVSLCDSQEQLDQLIQSWADDQLLLRVELVGTAEWLLYGEQLWGRHQGQFYHLEIVDDSLYLGEGLLASWADEATVRGQYVRQLRAELDQARDQRSRQVIQLALRRGIAAFAARGE
jgi:exonuclease SbcD